MAGLLLLADLKGERLLDAKAMRNCVRNIDGIYNWSDTDGRYVFFCEFAYGTDTTCAAMLANDTTFISIDGIGDASLAIALEIQARCEDPLHLIDDACSFDIIMSEVRSLHDLKAKIDSGHGREHFRSSG